MQIMPVTNSEIMEELDVQDRYVEGENLQAGIYYFSKLLCLFKTGAPEDRMSLALAAYNAGPARVYDAQKLAAYLGENPRAWSSLARIMPLLSKRYYSLHHFVWEKGRPSSGYFGSSKQTICYVASVMKTYHEYTSRD
jgi:membrane-bound lytic murein transglycosylase MltF